MENICLNKNKSNKNSLHNVLSRDSVPSWKPVPLIATPGPAEPEQKKLKLEPGQNSSIENIIPNMMTQTPGPSKLLTVSGQNGGSKSKPTFSIGQTAQVQESQSQKQVLNYGFTLASGKNVKLSEASVRKARELFSGDAEIDLPGEFYEPSVNEMNLEREIYETTMAFLADEEDVKEGISTDVPDSTTT